MKKHHIVENLLHLPEASVKYFVKIQIPSNIVLQKCRPRKRRFTKSRSHIYCPYFSEKSLVNRVGPKMGFVLTDTFTVETIFMTPTNLVGAGCPGQCSRTMKSNLRS